MSREEQKFERVEDNDPERCQGVTKLGQCKFKRATGSQFCKMHGGAGVLQSAEKEQKRNYRLLKWQSRMQEFADNDQVKSLREEVGISRMVLEEIVNKCRDSTELLMCSAKIADMVTRIEKLVSACHRLEMSTGMLLDKTAALQLANVIVEIISRHITNEDAIDGISTEIIAAICNSQPTVK